MDTAWDLLLREIAAKYGEELAGITICGTAGHFRGATEAESALLAAVAEGKGKESDPSFTADLMGWMCERCGNISIGMNGSVLILMFSEIMQKIHLMHLPGQLQTNLCFILFR